MDRLPARRLKLERAELCFDGYKWVEGIDLVHLILSIRTFISPFFSVEIS